MTTVLWKSSWRPHSHPRHAAPPTPILRRGFSVSAHRRALPLINAVNFRRQQNMAANYKVLQWNDRPEWKLTKEFMENYKIDRLRIFPGVVKEKLEVLRQKKKGEAKAERAYGVIAAHGITADRESKRDVKKKAGTGGKAGPGIDPFHEKFPIEKSQEELLDINENMPELVPYPDHIVTLEDTNLYEALKYVRPGHFLIPSETIPANITQLPNGRIPSFDITPIKQTKPTIVNIARFTFLANNPKHHIIHNMETIWTHFLKGMHVTCQFSFRPRSAARGLDFDWMWENCMHLRPEVVQRALPSTTRLALGPLTNGNEITWLAVPRINPVDYRARWTARQLEQRKLLQEGRGMLPIEERRRLKKELRLQMKTGKGNKKDIPKVSPMAMSVARLGIQRRIDDLLFKYEKLYGNIRSYVGTRYGTGRFLDQGERSVISKLVRMEKVDLLKYTPEPYIRERSLQSAQLKAATGQSHSDPSQGGNLQASEYEKLEAVVKSLGRWKLSSSRIKPWRTVFRDNVKREERERAFVKRVASAKLEEEQEDRTKYEDERNIQKTKLDFVQPTIVEHEEEGNEPTYQKWSEVAAEDKIETLRKEAQESWEDDDPLNSLLSPKANGVMERLQDDRDHLHESEHETNPRTGLLPYISKFEITDRVELLLGKHNSDKAPSPIRTDDQISKSMSTKYPSPSSGPKGWSSDHQSHYRMAIPPRNEYGSPDKEYRRVPTDAIASELPREPRNDRYHRQESSSPTHSSSGSTKSHDDISQYHVSPLEPFLPIDGIGADVIFKRQYHPYPMRLHIPDKKWRKGAPLKKPPKKTVVNEFDYNQKGRKKGMDSEKHFMLRAFKMDFTVAGNK
ncbi:hypothetical protein EG327_005912 [Venturia inaequalis]|uniref:Uncharacterized protein n=1 Tax=Venturia inaequalis TaxID=5025 RepID=A0A8H3V570_VENIN|nr:hypothetical protein EG327_005912 [Venturia inaequalis]